MNVLVAHPTRQHSHRLVMALEDAGCLHSYWTLLPDRRSLSQLPNILDRILPSAVSRHPLEFLPSSKVNVLIGPLLLQKISSGFASRTLRDYGEWASWGIFDHWVSRNLGHLRPDVVVGYEMCCANTFTIARELGIRCVLDAAAFHYTFQDSILREGHCLEVTWAGKRLRARKKLEIDLADQIVCVSELAKSSYIDAGVDPDRIVVNSVGCDVGKFMSQSPRQRQGAAAFIFVGMPQYHKGIDILARAYQRVLLDHPDAQLHVVGDASMARRLPGTSSWTIHGKLSHEQLGQLLPEMDCLVLPSRLESFGMVVVEALAAGVPVIVSDRAGASQAVIEGENGWVIPAGNEASLVERMLLCCRDIDKVRSMSRACVESASEYDWSHYAERTRNIFETHTMNVL